MKEAIVHPGPKVEIIDSPIPEINDDQLCVKVFFAGTNPKDWMYPEHFGVVMNQGDDLAGIVHKVGANVTEFKVGDRVAAFHESRTPHGSFAAYAVSWPNTTFHLPQNISFEEAATIPTTSITAALGLYKHLRLPAPWLPASRPTPLIVYGGSSGCGAFALKLAARSNIHPIIAVAGNGIDFVRGLVDESKGDVVIDYRNGHAAMIAETEAATKAAGVSRVELAFDAIGNKDSYSYIGKALSASGNMCSVLPIGKNDGIAESVEKILIVAGTVHGQVEWGTNSEDFGYVFSRYLTRMLKLGHLKGHPYEVAPNGLDGLQTALQNLKDGKSSTVKYLIQPSP